MGELRISEGGDQRQHHWWDIVFMVLQKGTVLERKKEKKGQHGTAYL